MNYKNSDLKKISNPPFKSSIDYRIGDYNTFRKAMLNLIKENGLLGGASILKSDKSDYGRAFVDMWAYLCDILTYYQERIANESYIRTAGLKESVIELLYLVDYLPHRGRSASTLVRFEANEKNIPPGASVVIPSGFKIRSAPAKGQESIIFETDERLLVSSDHNLMKLDGWRTSYKIEKGTTRLVLDKIYPELKIGDLIMISDDNYIDVIRIENKVDKDRKSQITWAEEKGLSEDYNLSNTKIQKFTQVVRPFGYNAPPSILSNVGVTLYKKKPNEDDGSSNDTDKNRELLAGRRAQIVDVSDRVIASATSDKEGKIMFKGLVPGSYRILFARSQLLTDESYLHPITTISSNHFQLLPGFESWFEAELEFGGSGIQILFDSWEKFSQELAQQNPFAKDSFMEMVRFLSPSNLQNMTNDILPDMRPSLYLKPMEPYPFDPVNDDIISSEVYLDKVYGDIRQGSFVILSKDDPSNQIDISRQLFKISRTGQMFHAKYGIGGNASVISLQEIDGKEGEKPIFSWDDLLNEVEEAEKAPDKEGKETKNIIDFLIQDTPSFDTKTAILKRLENNTAMQISDQSKKIVYVIKLSEKEEQKAILLKNDKKLLEFTVRKEKVGVGEDSQTKRKLYAHNIDSAFYKVRNTLIFTSPTMELGVDLRYASQESTEEYADNVTLEGMHTGLKTGIFLGITDNTSVIQGKLVDSNLKPLKEFMVTIYRIQKKNEGSSPDSLSGGGILIKIASKCTAADGSFAFDDLREDSYVVSLSLSLNKYWSMFLKYLFIEEIHDNAIDEIYQRELINKLSIPQNNKGGSSDCSQEIPSQGKKDKDKDNNNSIGEFIEHYLNTFLYLLAKFKDEIEKTLSHIEIKFTGYKTDILTIISDMEISIKERILPLLTDAESRETLKASSPSSPSLLNRTIAYSIEIIEQELEPSIGKLRLKTEQLLNQISNVSPAAYVKALRELAGKTIMRRLPIIEEIVIIVKEALQSPFRSTTYENNERLLGVTKMLNLRSNASTNIIMTFSIKDRLTYVESIVEYSKFQVTKIAGAPAFSEGKTHLSLDPPLQYRYVKGFAEIYGNIVPASHGETVKDEILGSGDASVIHQEFTLRKGPICYIASPLSPSGIKSTLKVIVNDLQWQETDDFLSSKPNDQHYITSLNEDGSVKITFGDGIKGSTLPTGVDNVHAQYRVGMGFKGNLKPNTPVVPQENNPAIKSISIPAGSYGGAEKILSQQKRSYRPHILTLGRAVSLEDYSNLATTFGEISKARAYVTMKGGQETVVLVVAGQKGRIVSPPSQMELRAYMDERRDISIPFEIESHVSVPVDIIVEVKVNDSYLRSKVVNDIQTRLGPGIWYDNNHGRNMHDENNSSSNENRNEGFAQHSYNLFSFERLNFGQKVTLSELYALVENIPGVDFAVVRKFCRRDNSNAINPVQEIINANANEILQCENDALDPTKGTINIRARGGVEL